ESTPHDSIVNYAARPSLDTRHPPLDTLLDPLPAFGREDRQLVGHVLRFADRSDHGHAGGGLELLVHAFARVAAPTLDEGIAGKEAAMELFQVVLVEPALGSAVEIGRVIEHEAGTVRVAEVLEIGDLHL